MVVVVFRVPASEVPISSSESVVGAWSEVHADDNDDSGVGDGDRGRGETDRLGGPRINPPRLPIS